MKRVLDACCGPRKFWFDKTNPEAVFVDCREGEWSWREVKARQRVRSVVARPDVVADFRKLPFGDGRFSLVVFDPPHLVSAGEGSLLALSFGRLEAGWEAGLRAGFAECFRVLREDGVLVFKWSEVQVPVARVLALTPVMPLFGNRCGRASKGHWVVFIKPGRGAA